MSEYVYTQADDGQTDEQRAAAAYHAFCLRRSDMWAKIKGQSKPEDLIPPQALLEDIAKYLSIIPTQAEISAKLSGVDALITAFETAAEIKCDPATAVILDDCRNKWRFAVRSFDPMMQQTSNEVWIIVADIVSILTRRAFGRDPYCQKWQPVVFDGRMGEM
jgi:hypothetical protein